MAKTMVRTTCNRCGDVELTPEDLELRICIEPERSVYAFTCPICREAIAKPAADPRVVRALASVGVPIVGWPMPAEEGSLADAPPLTIDDLIDLMLLVDEPDFVSRLTNVSLDR